jgi:hypothetical protein
MVDWRREGERLREACLSEEWREGSGDEIFDGGFETRDVVWRCDMAATTIGSKGGRWALVDGMRVTRESRCVAVDVVKDIADELFRRKLHNRSRCLLPTPQPINLML